MNYPESLANMSEEQFAIFKQGAADRYAELGLNAEAAQYAFDRHLDTVRHALDTTNRR